MTPTRKRAALYLRVSTEEPSVENQRPELELIRRLRATGFSVREIRVWITEWGLPARGARWHLTTVVRILRRQRAEGLKATPEATRRRMRPASTDKPARVPSARPGTPCVPTS